MTRMAPMLRIHGPRGVVELASEPADDGAGAAPFTRARSADEVPLTEIMIRDVVCAAPDLDVGALLALMVERRLGCAPVVDELGRPIGMVTRLDLVEHFAAPPGKAKPLVSDVMMPLAITLDDKATVAHAAALMAGEDMHHVMIVSGRRLVGIASTMDIARWLARNDELARADEG